MNRFQRLATLLAVAITGTNCYATPPALMTSSFMRHGINFEQCQQNAKEIMAKMNLEIQDHGNGTIGGFGEQSAAIVNCHYFADATYVQVAVSSQKLEAAEMIMRYITDYLHNRLDNQQTH